MFVTKLLGYADRLSVAPHERIRFMVSSPCQDYRSSVVRLIHGDPNPNGPGYREETIAALDPLRPGQQQNVHSGSHIDVGDVEPLRTLSSFTLAVWVWPTTPGIGREQGLLSKWSPREQAGYALLIDVDGRVRLKVGRAGREPVELASGEGLRKREWYFVSATYDAERGALAIVQSSLSIWANPEEMKTEKTTDPGLPLRTSRAFLIAAGGARDESRAHFNGKLDSPAVFRRALSGTEIDELRRGKPASAVDPEALVAAWDFGADPSGARVVDVGKHALWGRVVNMPTRAVTGHNWSGKESDFRLAPAEYGAIHFHTDDLEDAEWEVDLEWSVPENIKSGIYAVRLQTADDDDRIPFVVRASHERGSNPDNRIVFLIPTMTYLAYANFPLDVSCQRNRPPDWRHPAEPMDDFLLGHPELARSLYQLHEDGSGYVYSSARRPIITMRPTYRASFINAARHLSADLYLTDWLDVKGFAYDVITDHDLHADGDSALQGYRVVVTGSHPEYITAHMLETLERYLRGGGRLMYLGGNGFYWVTSVDPKRPYLIEVRRGFAGSRPWESEPGELHHSTTGELGGLWRYRGMPPNRLVGIGFSAEGVGPAGGYQRASKSLRDDLAFIFEGVSNDEVIGNFGLVMNCAVGDELDRADSLLGSPPQACVLASSFDVGKYYGVCLEDDVRWRAERRGGEARADIVYLENVWGGAVFSVGSISWMGSLSHSGYNNNVSRITENVLRRFAELPACR